jgi:hypothetical protein
VRHYLKQANKQTERKRKEREGTPEGTQMADNLL